MIFFIFSLISGSPLSQDIYVIQSSKSGVEFVYTVPEVKFTPIPYIPNTITQKEEGKPALPIKYAVLGIPIGAEIKIDVLEAEKKETTGIYIPPTFSFIKKDKDKIYETDVYWPESIVSIEERDFYRNQEIIRIRINPIIYNAKRQVCRIYKKIHIRVNFSGGGGEFNPDKLFEDVFKSILINYNEAKNWRKSTSNSVIKYNDAQWVKIELKEEGIYKIPNWQLKELNISNIDPRTIKIYNGGSKMITDTSDTLKEIPIYVLPDTTIIFYATSLAGWNKNDKSYLNPYSDTNVYWLTYGGNYGKRDSISSNETGNTPNYFVDTIHIEEDLLCPAKGGLGWVWEKLEREKDNPTFTRDYVFYAYNIYNDSCKIKISIYGWHSSYSVDDTISANIDHNLRMYLNGNLFMDVNWRGGNQYPKIFEKEATGLKSGENTLTLELYKGNSPRKDVVFTDYFEIVYNKKYTAFDGRLKFNGEKGSFNLSGFSDLPVIFNITDPINPKRIYNAKFENGIVKFNGPKGIYFAATNFRTPILKKESPYNIRNRNQNLDYIIITVPEFLDYAERLKRHREKQNLRVGLFSLTDIYNNFSFGITHSPYSIKNFLNFAYNNWGNPGYCLLLGAGTFDYKSDLEKNRIPPWESGYLVGEYGYPPSENRSYDWLFGNNNFAIGRITAKNKEEVIDVIDKIIKYENNPGVWQNRVLLIADDENPDGGIFVNREEWLYTQIPKNYDVFKIYVMNYPREISILKPSAKRDLIRHWSKGMFISSFGGHGNLYQLCHEQVFMNPGDILSLNNGIKTPFSQFWSCGVGCFERQFEDGMADFLQKVENKGSIGTVAESRAASGSGNMDIGAVQYFLIEPKNLIGEAIYSMFLSYGWPTNMMAFMDPGTKLPNRNLSVIIDSFPDTLIGGKPLKICGRAPGAKFVHITVRTSEYDYTYRWPDGSVTYKMRGKIKYDSASSEKGFKLCYDIIFEGTAQVNNGKWDYEFFIPVLEKDTIICGNKSKISVFAWNDTNCGSAAIDTIVIKEGGGNPNDTIGPSIKLFANGKEIKNNDYVPSVFTLTGRLNDPSGINIFNKFEPLHEVLSLRINAGEPIFLADYFKYDCGSATTGEFNYQLKLDEWDEEDTLYVVASDNLHNRSVYSVVVKIIPSSRLEIKNLMVFPNPVRGEGVEFSFFLSRAARVKLKIFTISGRLIKTIPEEDKLPGLNKIYWDTRDEFGNKVGNGVYIYKIEALAEEIQKDKVFKKSKFMILR